MGQLVAGHILLGDILVAGRQGHRIELVESFDKIRDGKGGYWPDNGYEWYAGI